jgi:hypothetical protein
MAEIVEEHLDMDIIDKLLFEWKVRKSMKSNRII